MATFKVQVQVINGEWRDSERLIQRDRKVTTQVFETREDAEAAREATYGLFSDSRVIEGAPTVKKFKKGQRVVLFSNWDCRGTYVYRHCIVKSCGKVQMVLEDAETGENLGNHFRPDGLFSVYEDMTDEQAQQYANELAIEFLADEEARLRRLAASEWAEDDHGYRRAMLAKLEDLHEPRVIEAKEAIRRIREGQQ